MINNNIKKQLVNDAIPPIKDRQLLEKIGQKVLFKSRKQLMLEKTQKLKFQLLN